VSQASCELDLGSRVTVAVWLRRSQRAELVARLEQPYCRAGLLHCARLTRKLALCVARLAACVACRFGLLACGL